MDPRLKNLIEQYQKRVAEAVQALACRFDVPRPQSNNDWAANGIPGRGQLQSGEKYFKHGYGCAFHFADCCVDFDFGENGEINGFEPYRLWRFAREVPGMCAFSSRDDLLDTFAEAEKASEIVKSDYILYYLSGDRKE